MYYLGDTGALVHETSPVPRILVWWHHRSQAKDGQTVLLLRPMTSVAGQGGEGGKGGSELDLIDESCDSSTFSGIFSPG